MPARRPVMRIFPQDIPDKIYYSISEVSEYTQVEPHVLRYWETKFSKLNPRRMGGNQRKYTRSDLDLLFVIIHLLHSEGYTLEGAEKKIRDPQAYEMLRARYGVSGTGRKATVPQPAPAAREQQRPATSLGAAELREIKQAILKVLDILSD